MVYENRDEAGFILANLISKKIKDGKNFVVCAIPRGGIVVGAKISQKFKIPMVPLVIKKLGAPTNEELAIGATTSFGKPVLDRWLIADLKVNSIYLKKEILKKKREARQREKFLGFEDIGKDIKGKNVIVVDDGIATGQTIRMSAKVLSQFGAKKIILAVPCAPSSAIEQVRGEFDEVVCPETREDFMAVGQFYRDFRPVDDEEVKKVLNQILKSKN